jgi:DnaJ-class molecular chaperone
MSLFNKLWQSFWTEVSTPLPSLEKEQTILPCKTCKGLGNVIVNNSEVHPCPACGGQGIPKKSNDHAGQKCAMCEGTGKTKIWGTSASCTFCDGTGYILSGYKLTDTYQAPISVLFNPESGVCPDCKGKKWVEIANSDTSIFSLNAPKKKQVCGKCGGTGRV